MNIFKELQMKAIHEQKPKTIPGGILSCLIPLGVEGKDGEKLEAARRILEKRESDNIRGWRAILRKYPCHRV